MADINTSNNASFATIAFITGTKLYFSLAEITALLAAAFSAFLRLKALILTDEDRLGALLATRITRICNGGTTAKVAAPYTTMLIAALNLLRARNGIASIITISSNKKLFNVLLTERFASLLLR